MESVDSNKPSTAATTTTTTQASNKNAEESRELDNVNDNVQNDNRNAKNEHDEEDDIFNFDEEDSKSKSEVNKFSESDQEREEDLSDSEADFPNHKTVLNDITSNISFNPLSAVEIIQSQQSNAKTTLGNTRNYSCSLPRNIPNYRMRSYQTGNMSFSKSSEDDDLDEYSSNKKDLKKNKANKRQKQQSSLSTNQAFDELLDEIESGDEETKANKPVNMDNVDENDIGKAISHLASSIVAKDGRELFGGLPNRRVPITSISQSYF
jgi:hypothetical protein